MHFIKALACLVHEGRNDKMMTKRFLWVTVCLNFMKVSLTRVINSNHNYDNYAF